MIRMSMIATASLLAVSTAWAGGGGKIQWRDGKQLDASLAEAKASGTPVMLYFTTSWCGYCKKLDAGAFSDDSVVKASEGMIRVLVDGDQFKDACKTYGVTGYPSVVFLNPDGEQVGKLGGREPADVKSQFENIVSTHARAPRWADGLEAGLKSGKTDAKPVVLVFADDGARSASQLKSLGDKGLLETLEKCVAVKLPYSKDGDTCKSYKVSSAPTILIVDARGEEAKTLKTLKGPKSGADLKKELDAILKKWEKEGGR